MNKIFEEIKKKVNDTIKEYLPELDKKSLEDDGAVFYMNGRNGTAFDWFVNERLSNFMVFYNDENNMGAIKLSLYNDGGVRIFVYGENGDEVIVQIDDVVNANKEEIFELAVLLRDIEEIDKWDTNIDGIDTDIEVSKEMIDAFLKQKEYMEPIIRKQKILNQTAYVSKRMLDEGWKVGYMVRDEANREDDSGWMFMIGNEDDELDDSKNIVILYVYQVCQIDGDIMKYIDSPVGTAYIRISSDELELDNGDKPIFCDKRK